MCFPILLLIFQKNSLHYHICLKLIQENIQIYTYLYHILLYIAIFTINQETFNKMSNDLDH